MDCNYFSKLYYLRNNKIFFQYITLIVKLVITTNSYQKIIRKLNNIIIIQLIIENRPNIINDL